MLALLALLARIESIRQSQGQHATMDLSLRLRIGIVRIGQRQGVAGER